MKACCYKTLFLIVAAAVLLRTVSGQECTSDGSLCDKHERCAVWKEEGQCMKNSAYMATHCAASCSTVETKVKPRTVECKDHHLRCPLWAKAGECDDNKQNMHKYCPQSCGLCDDPNAVIQKVEDNLCVDTHENCEFWASKGECDNNPTFMHVNCQKSCGTCKKPERQLGADGDLIEATEKFGVLQKASGSEAKRTLEVIAKSVAYIQNEIDDLPQNIVDGCQNRHELCSFWSAIGECTANEAFMLTNCGPSCQSCHLIDIQARCPPLENPVPALKPGDLNRMFERIVAMAPGNRTLTDDNRRLLQEEQCPEFTVQVHLRPDPAASEKELSQEVDKESPPWVIQFDNFLTPEEAQTIIDLGHKNGYERSRDVGAAKVDGSHEARESTGRTSENAWCSAKSGCRDHEVVKRVMERMSSVTDIPPENSEDLQLLRYEKTQFYNAHHDYIPYQRDRQCGPRILTFFLYLSDVESGGGTNFPTLGVTVEPKVGRAVLWPSVLNSDPTSIDIRTRHEALPVEAGVKFGANAWYHLYDYITPQARGCT